MKIPFTSKSDSSLTRTLLQLVVVISAFSVPAYANDAVILLNQMNDALHKLEYQGKLVYLKDGEASNLSIRHTLENGAEKEVVALLDENGDEYVKKSAPFSLSTLPKITPSMQEIYSFDLGGMGKVAGRPCRIVLARPKDRKRYLQKYCIDLDRSIILKYSLINQHQEPVESFMFTDFEVLSTQNTVENGTINQEGALNLTASPSQSPPVARKMMKTLATSSVTTSRMTTSLAPAEDSMLTETVPTSSALTSGKSANQSSPDNYSEWFFDSLPMGFNIVAADKVSNPEGEDEQIIISDGLSSVSVFISADKNVAKPIKAIRSGALNIVSRIYQGHAVTLVGEVPKSTLQDIFKGIKKATITE